MTGYSVAFVFPCVGAASRRGGAQNDIEFDHRWRLEGISSMAMAIVMAAP
jgi:hypothetical protein